MKFWDRRTKKRPGRQVSADGDRTGLPIPRILLPSAGFLLLSPDAVYNHKKNGGVLIKEKILLGFKRYY